jgi:hypothetical protein
MRILCTEIMKTPWLSVRNRTIPTEWPLRPTRLEPISWTEYVAWSAPQISTAVILGFLHRRLCSSFQVALQLSLGWVDPVSDPLLLRKSGSAGNRTRNLWACSQELWPLHHRRSWTERSPNITNYGKTLPFTKIVCTSTGVNPGK